MKISTQRCWTASHDDHSSRSEVEEDGMIVLVDVDHTLSDAAWRDDLIPAARATGDWTKYYAEMDQDEPIWFVATLVRSLNMIQAYDVVGLTARPEEYRAKTLLWLRRNSIMMRLLLMRPIDNHDPSPELKVALIKKWIKMSEVAFAIEDREDCARAMIEAGISVFRPMLGK